MGFYSPAHGKLDGIPVMPTPRDISAVNPYICEMRRDTWFDEAVFHVNDHDFFIPPLDPWRLKYYPYPEPTFISADDYDFYPPFPFVAPPMPRRPTWPDVTSSKSRSVARLSKTNTPQYYHCPHCNRYGVDEADQFQKSKSELENSPGIPLEELYTSDRLGNKSMDRYPSSFSSLKKRNDDWHMCSCDSLLPPQEFCPCPVQKEVSTHKPEAPHSAVVKDATPKHSNQKFKKGARTYRNTHITRDGTKITDSMRMLTIG